MTSIFLEDWLNHPEYWFNSKNIYDDYINTNYNYLIEEEWDRTNKDIKYHLSYIIIYDQIPRHIYRGNKNKIDEYLEKSLEIYNFVKENYDTDNLSIIEWCFFSLPMRHTNIHKNIYKVLKEAWNKLEKIESKEDHNKLIGFIKASYERIPKNQITEIEKYIPNKNNIIENITYFLKYVDILDYCPIILNNNNNKHMLYDVIKQSIKNNHFNSIQISLSGGVDSMVCSYIIKKLENELHINANCVFINYCNRSNKEFEFVRDWCNYIGLPLYVRHINEITRDLSMKYSLRDTYEKYTKDVRFNTYSTVWNKLGHSGIPQVLLGHNKNDCFENILTNMCYKIKYDNLKGMKDIQIVENIIFYRPLLEIKKEDIYDYAHKIGIPYLTDSTPKWSQRGKIRDIVRPCLEQWNNSMIDSMFNLSDRMSDYSKLEKSICDNMIELTKNINNGYELYISLNQLVIIETIWRKYFYMCNVNISNKCMEHFIKYINRIVKNKKYNISYSININVKTNIITKISKDQIVCLKIINN